MKIVIGLGNIGKEYDGTRHNIGFMALDNFLKAETFKEKDTYFYCEKTINNEKIIFVKPKTFMNNSGIAVKNIVDYYKINIEDILVIYDDMDFDIGKYKLKLSGSSAGHNGIKSIIKYLNTDNFKRVRIGISKPKYDVIDYVLGRFSKEELLTIQKVLDKINDIILDFASTDFEKLMNKYN